MPTLRSFLLFNVITALLSLQSCKKGDDPAPNPVPVVKPDTLSTGWSKQVIAGEPGLADIFFNSATTGYTGGSQIYKSTDGGNTWVPLTVSLNLSNIFMTSDGKAFFIGNNVIMRTIDGGSTFTNTFLPEQAHDIFFIDNNTGFAIAGDALYGTGNGGATWLKQITTGLPAFHSSYSSLALANSNTGWIVSKDGGIYRSMGFLALWQPAGVTGVPPGSNFGAVYAVSPTVIYLASFSGEVFKSTDGGANFSFIKKLENAFTDIHFITDQLGYACSGRYVYKTTDGGTNWSKVVSLGEASLTEIHFTDANHGWACGTGGTVLIFKQ